MEEQKPLDIKQPSEDNNAEDSDEVVFVSEGSQRPVVAFIDLSDDESNLDDERNESAEPAQDRVDAVKAQVQSTLDRLARAVEEDKESRRAHNELSRVQRDSLQAHGTYMLGLATPNPDMRAARKCVEYYAKKPALRPGGLPTHRRHQPPGFPTAHVATQPISCPVRNCLREFDNHALLLGHLKRFDHSPCDPCVMLKGVASVQYVCGPCQRVFRTTLDYEVHLLEKLKEDSSLGTLRPHKAGAPPLLSGHFACPACFLLFTLYDGCLQHMQQQGHFRSTFPIETQKQPCPILFPDYAKNMLVALCREVEFTVTCGSCGQGLRNNNHITEHFRARCQGGWPVALAKRSVSDVVGVFWAAGRCLQCGGSTLLTEADCAEHNAATGHMVWRFKNMQVSLIAFAHFRTGANNTVNNSGGGGKKINDGKEAVSRRPQAGTSSTGTEPSAAQPARNSHNGGDGNAANVANVGGAGGKSVGGGSTAAAAALRWVCECGTVMATEGEAFEHLMSMNGVRYRCLVCHTLFAAESIARLHMSRTHGGAHLSDYEHWCCSCRSEVPGGRDGFTGHLLDVHPGHSFYFERCGDDDAPATGAATGATEGAAESPAPAPGGGERASEAAGTSRDSAATEQKQPAKRPRKKSRLVGGRGLVYKCFFCKKASFYLDVVIDHLKSAVHDDLPKEGPHYLVLCPECRMQLPPGKSTCEGCVGKAGAGASGSGRKSQLESSDGGGYPFSAAIVKVQLDSERKPVPFVFTGSSSAASGPESGNPELPTADYLSTMSHVLLVDLDNWPDLFQKLPEQLETGIFIWGFKGERGTWEPPLDHAAFRQLQQQGCFFLHPQCSKRKDAANFAICLHAGRLDAQLPKHIPLSVLSGDEGFTELQQQFGRTGRPANIYHPHNTDAQMLRALITSISDPCHDAQEEAELREVLARSLKDMGSTQAPSAS